jgi:DHA1 family quinolone resistance protein-like MFS transporter
VAAGAALLSSFTYMPVLAKDYLSADEFLITILVGVYAVAAFVSSYFFGRAGDMHGKRMILRAGLLLSTLTFGLLIFTNTIETLFIVRILNGFCAGIYPGALAAYAYDSEMKMGRFASFGALGWGFGTLFAGFAASIEIHLAFLVSTIFLAVSFASAMTLPSIEQAPIQVPWFPVDTLKRNLPIFLAVLIRHSSAYAMWTLWSPFLISLGADTVQIGIIQAMNSIAQVVFMITIIDMFEYKKLVQVGLVTTSITFTYFLVVALYLDWIQMIPAQILLGFSWSCLYVGALKFVTERNVETSTASGLLTSMLSIAGIIGPIIAAIIRLFTLSYVPIILNAIILSLVALVIFIYSTKRNREPDLIIPEHGS